MTSAAGPAGETETTEVRAAHRLPEAELGAYLDKVLATGPILEIRQMSVGQSNPTYLLVTQAGEYILRKQPPGALLKSAHAIDREYRIMDALSRTGVPVPRMLHYATDATVIGTPFYVMAGCSARPACPRCRRPSGGPITMPWPRRWCGCTRSIGPRWA